MDFPKLRENERPASLHGGHRKGTGFTHVKYIYIKRTTDMNSDTGDKNPPGYTDSPGINSSLFKLSDSVYRDIGNKGDRGMEPQL